MKLIYWITTSAISIFLLWSSYTYLFNKSTIEGVRMLGFPDHFRLQLAALKIVAVFLLLLPQIPIQIKEWAYAGVGLFFITAIIAHMANKDSIIISFINLILLCVLIVSNLFLHKIIES